jgi:hypothetical protein
MAVVGHWDTITQAEKLTQATLVAGLVEENVKRGGLLEFLPVAQTTGQSITWNRESTGPSSSDFDIGATLAWQASSKIDQQDTSLKRSYVATVLDNFVEEVYGSINNYRAIQLMENKKSLLQKIEDEIIYGDLTYSTGNMQYDGLHALATASSTNFASDSLNIDQASAALSLRNMRKLEDAMYGGVDLWLFPKEIATRMDAYVQESGISTNTFGSLSFTINDVGRRIPTWNGTPIIRSDYLVAEEPNSGAGVTANARGKVASGSTNNYSIFALKFGNVYAGDPGLTYAFGNTSAAGEFWKTVFFEELEDQDASGLRLVHYGAMLDGASYAVGRIFDITDVAVVV